MGGKGNPKAKVILRTKAIPDNKELGDRALNLVASVTSAGAKEVAQGRGDFKAKANWVRSIPPRPSEEITSFESERPRQQG